jgi:hypothetical protein
MERKRLLLLGRAGAGKTRLLQHLACTYASEAQGKVLPIFVSLRYWNRPTALTDFIGSFLAKPPSAQLPDWTGLSSDLSNYLKDGAQTSRLLLLLDDYTRIPSLGPGYDEYRRAQILQFATEHPELMIAVAGRTTEYDGTLAMLNGHNGIGHANASDGAFHVRELYPWSKVEVREYLKITHPQLEPYVDQSDKFLTLVSNPFQLRSIVELLKTGIGRDELENILTSPNKLLTAYTRSLLGILEERDAAVIDDLVITIDNVQLALRSLAGGLRKRNKPGQYIPFEEALSYLADKDISREDGEGLLRKAADATILEIIENPGTGVWLGFTSLRLEQYYADQEALNNLDAVAREDALAVAIAWLNEVNPQRYG